MPEKHENTHRWGGPGASHEDRTKPEPETKGKEARTDTEVRFSHVSGGCAVRGQSRDFPTRPPLGGVHPHHEGEG